ncbi:hypothetical protein V501_10047 [Pseudogymnoascus sp. VKM F-4519 (FW-2642)]|nr:hypothetical protein V501_10047 [Pseudogymnoascus sp. VKM F-4519 (FW-2642)]
MGIRGRSNSRLKKDDREEMPCTLDKVTGNAEAARVGKKPERVTSRQSTVKPDKPGQPGQQAPKQAQTKQAQGDPSIPSVWSSMTMTMTTKEGHDVTKKVTKLTRVTSHVRREKSGETKRRRRDTDTKEKRRGDPEKRDRRREEELLAGR